MRSLAAAGASGDEHERMHAIMRKLRHTIERQASTLNDDTEHVQSCFLWLRQLEAAARAHAAAATADTATATASAVAAHAAAHAAPPPAGGGMGGGSRRMGGGGMGGGGVGGGVGLEVFSDDGGDEAEPLSSGLVAGLMSMGAGDDEHGYGFACPPAHLVPRTHTATSPSRRRHAAQSHGYGDRDLRDRDLPFRQAAAATGRPRSSRAAGGGGGGVGGAWRARGEEVQHMHTCTHGLG